jgi:hypothetical protein
VKATRKLRTDGEKENSLSEGIWRMQTLVNCCVTLTLVWCFYDSKFWANRMTRNWNIVMCQPNSTPNRLIHFTYFHKCPKTHLRDYWFRFSLGSCINIRRSTKSRVPKLIDYFGVVLVLKFEVCKWPKKLNKYSLSTALFKSLRCLSNQLVSWQECRDSSVKQTPCITWKYQIWQMLWTRFFASG